MPYPKLIATFRLPITVCWAAKVCVRNAACVTLRGRGWVEIRGEAGSSFLSYGTYRGGPEWFEALPVKLGSNPGTTILGSADTPLTHPLIGGQRLPFAFWAYYLFRG